MRLRILVFSWYAVHVAELEQVVGGEWFEIRERIHHSDQLFEFLVEQDRSGLVPQMWDAAADELDRAIEGGIFEFKRRRLVLQLTKLEEAAYTSELFGALASERIATTALLMVCAAERAILTGEIRFLSDEENRDEQTIGNSESNNESKTPTEPPPETGERLEDQVADERANADIKRIVSDIQEIVAADPSMKMHAAIKNILLQLQKYREEASTYQKLKEQATSYRLEMYSKTFAASFSKIFESIRKNYKSFLDEQEEIRHRKRGSMLDTIETKAWARLILRQIEEINRIRATFLFVEREHSGMREPLVALGARKEEIIAMVDQERRLTEDLAGGEDAGHRLSRIIAVEVARRLRLWAHP